MLELVICRIKALCIELNQKSTKHFWDRPILTFLSSSFALKITNFPEDVYNILQNVCVTVTSYFWEMDVEIGCYIDSGKWQKVQRLVTAVTDLTEF